MTRSLPCHTQLVIPPVSCLAPELSISVGKQGSPLQELDLALLDILPPFQAEVRQCVFEEKLPRGGNPRDDPVGYYSDVFPGRRV